VDCCISRRLLAGLLRIFLVVFSCRDLFPALCAFEKLRAVVVFACALEFVDAFVFVFVFWFAICGGFGGFDLLAECHCFDSSSASLASASL